MPHVAHAMPDHGSLRRAHQIDQCSQRLCNEGGRLVDSHPIDGCQEPVGRDSQRMNAEHPKIAGFEAHGLAPRRHARRDESCLRNPAMIGQCTFKRDVAARNEALRDSKPRRGYQLGQALD